MANACILMKRRKFVVASGCSVLTGSVLDRIGRPAVGVNFKLTATPKISPSKVESILLEFEELNIRPLYLDDNVGLDVTVGVNLEGINKDKSKSTNNIDFSNNQLIDSGYIQDRSGVDITTLVLGSITEDSPSIRGDVRVEIDHSDILETYRDTFIISEKNIIDSFEDGGLSEYSGATDLFSFQSTHTIGGNSAIEGSYSGDGWDDIWSLNGLNRYPRQGDKWSFWGYSNGGNRVGHGWAANSGSTTRRAPSYGIEINPSSDTLRLYYTDGESFDTLDTSSPSISANSWYRFVIEWFSDGLIEAELYDFNNNFVDSVKKTDERRTDGGIVWTLNDNGSNTGSAVYDSAVIL